MLTKTVFESPQGPAGMNAPTGRLVVPSLDAAVAANSASFERDEVLARRLRRQRRQERAARRRPGGWTVRMW
ncbi:hypothetical protein [Elongatibacter sediminis]|uniref:Uncharacterized protein n=1 Tax=Elongatibacter sediminis TaxID=3119006 RepID=A0AAW9R8Q5_9GAMM